MEKKTKQIIVTTSIIIFIIILIAILIYAIFYSKSIICDETLQIKKVGDCNEQCTNLCIHNGFNPNMNHTFLGETITVSSGNKKEANCICKCNGCKE